MGCNSSTEPEQWAHANNQNGDEAKPTAIVQPEKQPVDVEFKMGLTALLLGASGETGGEILNLLVSSETYSKVIIIVRRTMELSTGEGWEKVEQGVVDFANLEQHQQLFSGVDIAFCCLGYRGGLIYAVKLARFSPPDENVRKIDHGLVVAAAKLLKAGGCPSFVFLSAMGSSHQSSLVYLEAKGRAENDIRDLGFDIFISVRPNILINERNKPMFGETFIKWLAKKTDASGKWSITNKMLAQAMVSADNDLGNEDSGENKGDSAKEESKNSIVRFLEHSDIVELAQKTQPAL